jgi:hypothetical protein
MLRATTPDFIIFKITQLHSTIHCYIRQFKTVSRDLGSIGPDLGSFGTMICLIWEVLVLRVGKYYDAACHVTWEVLGTV